MGNHSAACEDAVGINILTAYEKAERRLRRWLQPHSLHQTRLPEPRSQLFLRTELNNRAVALLFAWQSMTVARLQIELVTFSCTGFFSCRWSKQLRV